MFKPISPHPNFPKIEEEILKFWQKEKIFEKSLAKTKGSFRQPAKKFIFYEGPPTANGRPGIHHVLARAYKDIICRFQTMAGFYVKRRAGWDTHGLPVEIEVEKSLGLKNKKEIENYGVAKFNAACRKSVWQYKKEWEDLTERIGFWLDLKNPYVTSENSYIEKVWQVLKEIFDKGLIYLGFKVVPHCPRCETTLSSHEVAQGYRMIEEEAIYVKFALKNERNKYFLVWTTTPWTLPGNSALAINPDFRYVEISFEGENYILAKDRLKIFPEHKIIRELNGGDLVGKSYQPLYDGSKFAEINSEKDYRLWASNFVSKEEGTGIVHIAPAFGEDDLALQKENNFSILKTVDESGRVLSEIGKDKFIKSADKDIVEDLNGRQLIFKKENVQHDYPFCWRCESPLIYFAKECWFIKMNDARDELLTNNQQINWYPNHLKNGRFGNFLTEAKDWALSRERFWGTPLPIWCHQIGKSEIPNPNDKNCDNIKVIGSIKELLELSEKPIEIEKLDLHRPYIDEIVLKCEKCGKKMQRVKEILDVWFDSGAMPFASGEFPENFPADFISEAVDQTRGWFYTLLAISTLKGQGPSYKNVITLSHVLDDKGKKMSKSRGNVIDPSEVINVYGADALRWYFFSVNQPGEPKKMAKDSPSAVLRQFILMLWNVYAFFTTYANIDGWQTQKMKDSEIILDRWIISRFDNLAKDSREKLENFDVTNASREIQHFINDLSTWYLRRSRKRRDEKFYSTLYKVLMGITKISAPFVPFTSESIFQNLRKNDDPLSVHLCQWPEGGAVDKDLIKEMEDVRKLAEIAHAQRAMAGIRLRQPLGRAKIQADFPQETLDILQAEINVHKIIVDRTLKNPVVLEVAITPELKAEGIMRDIIRLIQGLRKKADLVANQKVYLYYSTSEDIEKVIKEFKKNISEQTSSEIIAEKKSVDHEDEAMIDNHKIWLGIKK